MDFKKIKIKSKKDFTQFIIGVGLITIVFLANALLSFLTLEFSFETLKTGEYWATFALLYASELLVMFGMFIIRKRKDLEADKIVKLQEHINNQREVVYGVDKVTEAESWLLEVYNYREKLLIYEKHIQKLRGKIKLRKPKENEKHYKYKLKRYNKEIAKREYCIEQLEFIKKDKERLSQIIRLLRNEQVDNLQELTNYLESDDYDFNSARIRYKEVYWGNLLSDVEETKNKPQTPFFSERKELYKKAIKKLAVGILVSGFMSGLLPPLFNNFGWNTLLEMIIRIGVMVLYMAFGIILSKDIILGTYYRALEKRKSIYNQMLKDLGISQIEIEGGADENKEIQ